MVWRSKCICYVNNAYVMLCYESKNKMYNVSEWKKEVFHHGPWKKTRLGNYHDSIKNIKKSLRYFCYFVLRYFWYLRNTFQRRTEGETNRHLTRQPKLQNRIWNSGHWCMFFSSTSEEISIFHYIVLSVTIFDCLAINQNKKFGTYWISYLILPKQTQSLKKINTIIAIFNFVLLPKDKFIV